MSEPINITKLRQKLVDPNKHRDFEFLINNDQIESVCDRIDNFVNVYSCMIDDDDLRKIKLICYNLVFEYISDSDIDIDEDHDENKNEIGVLCDSTVNNVINLLTVDSFSGE